MLILPTILALPLMLGLSNGEAAEVRSLLASKCFACHGPDGETREAGLRLDTLDGQRSRSRSGSIIMPGDPEASLLLKRVQHEDPDRRMPPEGVPLPLVQVAPSAPAGPWVPWSPSVGWFALRAMHSVPSRECLWCLGSLGWLAMGFHMPS